MERQNFEDSWKKAFEQAEVAPSENVWTNIELDLEKANGTKLKRRLVLFQLLAAASVIFALGLGAGIFIMKNSYEESARQLAANAAAQNGIQRQSGTQASATPAQNQSQPTAIESNKVSTLNPSHDKTSTIASSDNKKFGINKSGSNTASTNEIASIQRPDETVLADVRTPEETVVEGIFAPYRDGSASKIGNANLPAIVEPRKVELVLAEEKKVEADPVQLMLAKLDQREREVREAESKKEKADRSEKLWTSVGFSAGSFNTVNSGVSAKQSTSTASFFAQNSAIANPEAKASGTTYSVGANVGTRLSARWVFQGGVNYLTQSSDYTAHSAVINDESTMSFRPASINELDKLSTSDVPAEEKLVSTAPYNVNNNSRYLSIPLQAGYMVINKNFGLQLNAGVATDLFLQNTVSAEGGNLDKTSQGIGDDSPYRSVNLSGLAGTELSYRFSKNYRVAINPGLRYPFNSVYKSEIAVKSTPITFDIGLRFGYIFH
ncbi:MAG TPA: outer membrane beta-barrel protein [Chryseosolibacter sp.]